MTDAPGARRGRGLRAAGWLVGIALLVALAFFAEHNRSGASRIAFVALDVVGALVVAAAVRAALLRYERRPLRGVVSPWICGIALLAVVAGRAGEFSGKERGERMERDRVAHACADQPPGGIRRLPTSYEYGAGRPPFPASVKDELGPGSRDGFVARYVERGGYVVATLLTYPSDAAEASARGAVAGLSNNGARQQQTVWLSGSPWTQVRARDGFALIGHYGCEVVIVGGSNPDDLQAIARTVSGGGP